MSSSHSQCWLDFPYGKRFDLSGTTSVGRAPDNTLVINDNEISRRHALIQAQDEGDFWLVDLGSINGTCLNDRRISQPVKLKAGDVIQMSGVKMTFGMNSLREAGPPGDQVASTIHDAPTAKCWTMMVDIIGSSELAQQLSPEHWPRMTGSWFKDCGELIEAHEGKIMKYLGDGFFCYWLADEDAPAKLRATLLSLKAIQRAASPPFRIVVHYGDAVLGSGPTTQELNLRGPEVDFTFRIEKLAGSFRQAVMLSEAASVEIGLLTQFFAKAKVEGFSGSFSFFAPV